MRQRGARSAQLLDNTSARVRICTAHYYDNAGEMSDIDEDVRMMDEGEVEAELEEAALKEARDKKGKGKQQQNGGDDDDDDGDAAADDGAPPKLISENALHGHELDNLPWSVLVPSPVFLGPHVPCDLEERT